MEILMPRAKSLWNNPIFGHNTRDSLWAASSLPEAYGNQHRINQLCSTCAKNVVFSDSLLKDQNSTQCFNLILLGESTRLCYLEGKTEVRSRETFPSSLDLTSAKLLLTTSDKGAADLT